MLGTSKVTEDTLTTSGVITFRTIWLCLECTNVLAPHCGVSIPSSGLQRSPET